MASGIYFIVACLLIISKSKKEELNIALGCRDIEKIKTA
jgi:hypothetical protein